MNFVIYVEFLLACSIHFFLLLGDFWQELFNDEILWFLIGPISALSIYFFNLGFIGILYFIRERSIKYATYNGEQSKLPFYQCMM